MRTGAYLTSLLVACLVACRFGYAQVAGGWIEGRVHDAESSQGIEGAQVSVRQLGGREFPGTLTDDSGTFRFVALPPDDYELRCEKSGYPTHLIRPVRVQSGRASPAPITMRKSQAAPQAPVILNWAAESINLWGSNHGSIFDPWRMANLPTARNIWALLENQDPSSVTNNTDEGGITTGTVPLVGSRGGSWTQNSYRFDGLDVTDPFEPGKPLIYADYGGLQELQVSAAFHSSSVRGAGASFNMTSRSGGAQFHAQAEGYYLGQPFQSNNLDDRLRAFGFSTSPHFKRFGEGQFLLGGRVPRINRWSFFTSLGVKHLSKHVPGFAAAPLSSVWSGLLRFDGNLRPADQLAATATGQIIHNSNLGARQGVSPSATLHGYDRFEVVQGHWTRRQSARRIWHLGFGFSHVSPTDTFQAGVSRPNSMQLFTGEMTGAAPVESDSARSRFSLVGQGQILGRIFGRSSQHQLDFGFDLEESMATEERRIFQDIQLLFFPANVPEQVVEFNTPSRAKLRMREFSLFIDDAVRLADRVFLRLGLTLDTSSAFLPPQRSDAGVFVPARNFAGAAGVVSWTTIAPRAGLALPLLRRQTGDSRLLASFSRYYHLLPASYANYANPTSLGGQVFRWEDMNLDGRFQTGERGALLRSFGGPVTSVDPHLRRPLSDEWSVGFEQRFGQHLQAGVRLYRRDEKRLAGKANVGVRASAFTPVNLLDLGDDNIAGTSDDRTVTVFNQDPDTLGHDRLQLANPEGLRASYRGLEATARRRMGDRGFLSLSFCAYKAVGMANPGNSEFENDSGVVGSLFDDPNTLLNARGRLFFDRGYVGKTAAYFSVPLDLHLGSVIKYFDGLPFGRKLIVTGLNQGPFFVMTTPRGQPGGMRTQFNLTFDQRIGREFNLGRFRCSLLVDIFNLLNLNKNLREFDISGPFFPLRRPFEFQNPRVFRFGIRLSL